MENRLKALIPQLTEHFKQRKKPKIVLMKLFFSLSDWFNCSKEVPGTFVSNTGFHQKDGCRIDRLLTPTQKIIDCGWRSGAIGVEIKKVAFQLGDLFLSAWITGRQLSGPRKAEC